MMGMAMMVVVGGVALCKMIGIKGEEVCQAVPLVVVRDRER